MRRRIIIIGEGTFMRKKANHNEEKELIRLEKFKDLKVDITTNY